MQNSCNLILSEHFVFAPVVSNNFNQFILSCIEDGLSKFKYIPRDLAFSNSSFLKNLYVLHHNNLLVSKKLYMLSFLFELCFWGDVPDYN